ncbi:MAG: lipopolysaccharide transport periplasmic protein LptA [Rhodobacteraceae bacterium]|nr:lipopolysaccharide transport periplasmic protein LptA [Paracoccaceae bacterium]
MKTHLLSRLLSALLALSAPGLAQAQAIAFGGLKADTSAPVEVTADELYVNQSDGTATFAGNVVVIQGAMKLAAGKVLVIYGSADRSRIEELHASGGVTLASGTDAAEAKEAVYTIESGVVELTGDVLLTQGQNVISGQKLVVDLQSGTGRMDGRVRTILTPGGN